MQDAEDDHCWTEAFDGIAKKMSKYLEDSEVAKVRTRELKEQVLSPNESSVNVVRIARQAQTFFQIFRQGANEVLNRQQGEMGGALESAGAGRKHKMIKWEGEGQ